MYLVLDSSWTVGPLGPEGPPEASILQLFQAFLKPWGAIVSSSGDPKRGGHLKGGHLKVGFRGEFSEAGRMRFRRALKTVTSLNKEARLLI